MKTILITGGTGFLGKHLVRRLQEAEPEARLRLLCRSDPGPRPPRIEVARGDITAAGDVASAVEGADEIYHLAGFVERETSDPWRMYRTHVEGTRNLCEAARRFGVKRIVIVSSSGTVAVGREPRIRDEQSGYAKDVVAGWPYYLSKIYQEKLALWYVEHHKLPIVIANPSLLLGPGDERRSSTGDVALFLEGQIMVVPTGGLNIVDVRDVAAGLIGAMRRGRIGERYLFGGPNWTFAEWMERVAELAGVRPPLISPPLGLALFSARLLRRVLPWIGRQFKLDDQSIKMSALYWYCDSRKARYELGFQSRDPMDTLRDTMEDLYAADPALRRNGRGMPPRIKSWRSRPAAAS